MHLLVDTFVPGRAKTKGSLRHRGGGRMEEAVIGSKDWRRMMCERMKSNWRTGEGGVRDAVSGGVAVSATFSLPCARGSASLITQGSGDIDKLLRNLLDAMQDAGVIVNDAQVVRVISEKRIAVDTSGPHGHAAPGSMPQGVHIQVWSVF